MILSPSSSSSLLTAAVTGGGVVDLGLVSGGTLAGFVWGAGGWASSSPSCENGWMTEVLCSITFATYTA